MNKEMYDGINNARLMIAQLLILGYPNARYFRELPQELIAAFDVLTDMLLYEGGDLKNGVVRTMFKGWWRTRRLLESRWANDKA